MPSIKERIIRIIFRYQRQPEIDLTFILNECNSNKNKKEKPFGYYRIKNH